LEKFTLSGTDTAGGVYTYDMDLYGNITGVAAATGNVTEPGTITGKRLVVQAGNHCRNFLKMLHMKAH
jgi:hypothetical protein